MRYLTKSFSVPYIEFAQHLAPLGESARCEFGEHKFAVYDNVKDAIASGDQFRLHTQSLAQIIRQPSGIGLIVSHCAIMDFNSHSVPPGDSVSKPSSAKLRCSAGGHLLLVKLKCSCRIERWV